MNRRIGHFPFPGVATFERLADEPLGLAGMTRANLVLSPQFGQAGRSDNGRFGIEGSRWIRREHYRSPVAAEGGAVMLLEVSPFQQVPN
jgi:hypothetical protein